MKPSKNIILSLALLCLVIWIEGCFSSSISSNDAESSDTTAQTQNEISTFSLPATIAKLDVDPIDSTTLYFVPSANPSDTIIGTLFWKHKSSTCGRSALLASGTVLGVVDSDSKNECRSAMQINSTIADIELAIVNFGSGTKVDENGEIVGSVSLPTGIVIYSPLSGVTNTHTLTVLNTFMSTLTDLSSGIEKDILRGIGFFVDGDDSELLAFPTQDVDDSIHLTTVPTTGGSPEDILDLNDVPLSIKNTIAEADSDSLYLLDESYALFRINVDGIQTELNLNHLLNESTAEFAPQANGEYLVYTADAGNGYVGLGLFDAIHDTDLGLIPFAGTSRNYTSMEADWLNSSTLVIISKGEDGYSRFQRTDVSGFIQNGETAIVKTLFTQDTPMGNPAADNGANGYVFYICSEESDANKLCRYNNSDGSKKIVAEYFYPISNVVFSGDRSSYVIFELDSTPNYLCLHNISTAENSCFSSGTSVATSPNNNNIISFMGTFAGTRQVGIFNTENNYTLNPVDLEISPSTSSVAGDGTLSFMGTGGAPPYTYTLEEGEGSITSLGLYTAPSSSSSEQTETVTITDADGNTAMATLTIPAAGSLDETIGTDGIASFNINDNAKAWDNVEQADGKILIAGSASNGSNTDLFVMRLKKINGELDTNFGTNGIVRIDIAGESDTAYGIDLQSDGKIVIVGEASVSGTNQTVIVRLKTNGDLDTTFGSSGITRTALGSGDATFNDVKVLSNENILACGYASTASTNKDFLVARFTNAGVLDASFSSDGYVLTDFSGNLDAANSLAVQSDHYIVVGGRAKLGATDRFALARYDADGNLDTTFGSSGLRATAVGSQFNVIRKIILEDDGNIVAAGVGQNSGSAQDFAMARYDSSGNLDTNFSSDGYEIFSTPVTTNAGAYDVVVQTDGKYVLGGASGTTDSKFYLIRINTDGSIDTTYGASGIASTEIGTHAEIHALFISPDNQILATGYSSTNSVNEVTVVRYWP